MSESTAAPETRAEAYPERVGGREGEALGTVVPDRETFRALAAQQRVVPVSMRLLADEDTPVSLYRRLTADGDPRGTFLLESAGEGESSRYSIIGARARAVLTERDGEAVWRGDVPAGVPTSGSPVEALRAVAGAFRAARQPHLPPFSGGLVGMYLKTPGMREEGSLAPTQDGTALAKDVWMLGIGASLLMQGSGKGSKSSK